MGDALKGASTGNEFGHFEDSEFLEFHKSLLRKYRSDLYTPRKELAFDGEDIQIARTMLERRNDSYDVWGWKDPRTTLFLDSWAALSPDIRFLFLYRDPFAVVESICKQNRRSWLYLRPWVAPASWLHYNRLVLDFFNRHRERCMLANIDGIKRDSRGALGKISGWLGIELNVPFDSVYVPGAMTSGGNEATGFPVAPYVRFLRATITDHLMRVYDRLESQAFVAGTAPDATG